MTDNPDYKPERRQQTACSCGYNIFYREGNTIFCLSNKCNKSWPARRKEDAELPTFGEIKQDWQ
jgi:hypothetical protein